MLSLLLAMIQNPKPVGPLPSQNHLAWHERQYYAFVHFGPNTFTGEEWGHGNEDPKLFNPKDFDAMQWCRTFKEAGMTGVIVTAKHHDGFALWPSKYTTHSVAASPWRDGKGDVLKELSEACKEYGLWMGVYLSPWDRNHPTYGSELYNDTFVAMLGEVLTQYGDIKEVWFDGANGEGPNGKRQVYDWPRYEETVRRLAPNAVIFGDGGDVRWVGNEQGFVGETNWNFLPSGHWPGDQSIYRFLNSGDPKGDKYSPGECDVSIRPGWFWRKSENERVKTLDQLKEIWYRSVGYGGNLLLNVPPDDRGLIHENDARALMEFKRWREATFAEDLLSANAANDAASRPLLDGDEKTFWTTTQGKADGAVSIALRSPTMIDHVAIEEDLRFGQKIQSFTVTIKGSREVVVQGTTVGFHRVVKFDPVEARVIQISVKSRSGGPVLRSVKAFLGPPNVTATGGGPFIGKTVVALSSDNPSAKIHFTIDGSLPTPNSPVYRGPLDIERTCTLRAIAVHGKKQTVRPLTIELERFDSTDLWPATVFVREPDPGVRFTYYEQGWQTLNQLKGATKSNDGVSTTGLDISHRNRNEHFGFVFEGVLHFPQDGLYTFTLASDDGSRLYIDDKMVIDHDGLHGMEPKRGLAPLASGYHRVRVEYFNASGGLGLRLDWQGPGLRTGQVPASAWRH